VTVRASALALALTTALVTSSAGCGPKPIPPPPARPAVPLHLDSACELAPSAGVEWVVDAKPRTLAEIADLIPVIALVVPEARFATFAAAHGGIDVRQITDLCIAKYKDSLLTVARSPLDPVRVEKEFTERVTHPGGRSVDVVNPRVVRVWGEVNGEAQELVLFAREVVALGQGRAGPVRAAESFALGKLRRAAPVLRGPAIAPAVRLIGDAPIRAFAAGPFEGELGQGLGGLMRASTAVGVSARFVGAPAQVAVRIVLAGAWGKDAPAAAERLAAAVNVVAESPFGRLLGLNHPLAGPHVRGEGDALFVEITLDATAVARGLHDALDAEIGDIMQGGRRSAAPDQGNP
jgi:hypothetical protein